MEAEEFLRLFDCHWFEQRVFTAKPPSPPPINHHLPFLEVHEELEESSLPHTPTLQIRSLSDRFLGSDSPSPNLLILKPKLKKILSGKEIREISKPEAKRDAIEMKKRSVTRRNKIGSSKSLSELEFEELKGFMDLGFVFSEEDKDSSLVSVVPGLQRLERKANEVSDDNMISRPYLSESWGFLDRKMVNKPLIDWRSQVLHNKINMKDHLRAWAQTVASTVRL